MAMQGEPSLGNGHGTTTKSNHQKRLDAKEEMVDRFNHMKVGPDKTTDAAVHLDRSHFELTDSMPSFELGSVEARDAQLWPSALPPSESPCSSCCARSLSSTEGTCTSCSAKPLSSKESDSSFVVLRPNKKGVQMGGSGVSRKETEQVDVQYKLLKDRGADVDDIPPKTPQGCLPPNTEDGQKQVRHQRQGSCDERRTTNGAQNRDQTKGECSVRYKLIGDPGVEGGISLERASKGYSPLNTRDERRGESSNGRTEPEKCSESRGINRAGVSGQTTKQYDVQCIEAKDKEAKTSKRGAGGGDQILNDAGKGFGPLRSKEEENSDLLHSDDEDEEEFHDILIIYHKKDVHHLKQFKAMCNKHRWSTITKDEFPIGTRHFSQFEVALVNCYVAVALITSNFLGDEMADHEHQTALVKSIERKAENFIPVVYEEDLELPSYLKAITCGHGYKDGFEKQFVRTMKRVIKKKQQRMNGQLPVNQLDSLLGGNGQGPNRQSSPKPPALEQDVPSMFRSLQGQLSPGPYAQRFFRDRLFRELCLVLDLCNPLGTPYWYRLAEHIGFDPQDIEWLDKHGRCAANVLEVYCCKHSKEDKKLVIEELREILENRLDYIQAGGIVGQELESPQDPPAP